MITNQIIPTPEKRRNLARFVNCHSAIIKSLEVNLLCQYNCFQTFTRIYHKILRDT